MLPAPWWAVVAGVGVLVFAIGLPVLSLTLTWRWHVARPPLEELNDNPKPSALRQPGVSCRYLWATS